MNELAVDITDSRGKICRNVSPTALTGMLDWIKEDPTEGNRS